MPEQTESAIAEGGHDFGSIGTMQRAFVLPHRHIFDVMDAVFNGPMSSFQLEQALRVGKGGGEAADPIAHRLFPDPFGEPAAAQLKDLLQANRRSRFRSEDTRMLRISTRP